MNFYSDTNCVTLNMSLIFDIFQKLMENHLSARNEFKLFPNKIWILWLKIEAGFLIDTSICVDVRVHYHSDFCDTWQTFKLFSVTY